MFHQHHLFWQFEKLGEGLRTRFQIMFSNLLKWWSSRCVLGIWVGRLRWAEALWNTLCSNLEHKKWWKEFNSCNTWWFSFFHFSEVDHFAEGAQPPWPHPQLHLPRFCSWSHHLARPNQYQTKGSDISERCWWHSRGQGDWHRICHKREWYLWRKMGNWR